MAVASPDRVPQTKYEAERVRDEKTNANYVCDCGRTCKDKFDLDEHKLNNCSKLSTSCAFCQENQSSSAALKDHLMLCGNKTDQCPKCRRFIRRAVFAYHYENDCADLEETDTPTTSAASSSARHRRHQSNSNRPPSRENIPNGHDQENDTDYNRRSKLIDGTQSSTSNNSKLLDTIKCEYCDNRCSLTDYKTHKDNCLKNPTNVNKQRRPISSELNQTRIRSSSKERGTQNDIVRIPCEFCNEPIELSNWSTHTQDCRDKENRRIETRAQTINREPVIEQFPCEHCQEPCLVERLRSHERICSKNPDNIARMAKLVNSQSFSTDVVPTKPSKTDRSFTRSSGYQSLQPSSISAYNLSPRSRDIVDRIDDIERKAASQYGRLPSPVSINIHRNDKMNREGYVKRSVVPLSGDELSVRRRSRRDSDSQLMNSSNDISVYDNTSFLLNGHRSNSTQSLPHRSGSATSDNRHRESRRTMPDLISSDARSRSTSRHSLDARGSLRSSAARASNHSSAINDVLFHSPRDANEVHEPVIKERDRRAALNRRLGWKEFCNKDKWNP